jgi:hypothetical protein
MRGRSHPAVFKYLWCRPHCHAEDVLPLLSYAAEGGFGRRMQNTVFRDSHSMHNLPITNHGPADRSSASKYAAFRRVRAATFAWQSPRVQLDWKGCRHPCESRHQLSLCSGAVCPIRFEYPRTCKQLPRSVYLEQDHSSHPATARSVHCPDR